MRMLTVEEVADLLRMTKQWVYVMARRGELPCVRFGRRIRVSEMELSQWLRAGVPSAKGSQSRRSTIRRNRATSRRQGGRSNG
jgi:excisionase family DNA binding protein